MLVKINNEELTFVEKIKNVHDVAKEFDQSVAELTPVTEILYGIHTQLMSPIHDSLQYLSGSIF